MKKNSVLVFLLLISCYQITAQQLSERSTVSVVTCGPGTELYSAFGHSAFRVYDPVNAIDKIYNYGTFDFNAPNFYLNFAKGKLIYLLSTTSFNRFLYVYDYENRWVKLQVLNLSPTEVQEMYAFLENNAKPENRKYAYDFFYDNCSTKIEEVVIAVLGNKVTFPNNHITTHKSHRDLINDYTKEFEWGKFGIDLALGSVIDDEATKDDYKFLPDYILEAFAEATIQTNKGVQPLVKKELSVLKQQPIAEKVELFTPFNVLVVLSLLIIYITIKNQKNLKRSKWLDFLLFFITGLIGVVVLLLWFATNHTATFRNLNFLWAFAPNMFVAFVLLKTKTPHWIKNYLKLLLVLLGAMLILWAFQLQVFNYALVPFICALFIRYRYLVRCEM